MNGSKHHTEATWVLLFVLSGRRAPYGRYKPVPKGRVAAYTGDYAGMSNDKAGENPVAESLRFPGEGKSAQG